MVRDRTGRRRRFRSRFARSRGAICATRPTTPPSATLGELGFVILHRCGESFYFLLVCTWRNENELWETVWAKTGDDDVFFRPWPAEGAHRPTFCVWELGAVCHEREAWTRYLLLRARRSREAARTCATRSPGSCDGERAGPSRVVPRPGRARRAMGLVAGHARARAVGRARAVHELARRRRRHRARWPGGRRPGGLSRRRRAVRASGPRTVRARIRGRGTGCSGSRASSAGRSSCPARSRRVHPGTVRAACTSTPRSRSSFATTSPCGRGPTSPPFLSAASREPLRARSEEPYRDASGNEYLPMFVQPVLVYEADAEALRRAYERASEPWRPRLPSTRASSSTTGHDEANRAEVARVRCGRARSRRHRLPGRAKGRRQGRGPVAPPPVIVGVVSTGAMGSGVANAPSYARRSPRRRDRRRPKPRGLV